MPYHLNEHFWSIQGEGEHAGHTAVFLRLQGCPVGCAWCDSKLTWYAGGERVASDDVPGIVQQHPESELIVVTGGEPLLYDLDDLFTVLRAHVPQRAIHLETSGVFPFKGRERPDWTTLSPKYPAGYRVAGNVLLAASELKYVVDEHFSAEIAHAHLRELRSRRPDDALPPVRLMPEGCPPRKEMIERTLAILRDHPMWRFGPRLQYDYANIAEQEGLNNRQVSIGEARAVARQHRRGKEHTALVPITDRDG